MVVNGRLDVVGAKPGEIEGAVRRANRGQGGPAIAVNGARITVGAGQPRHGAEILLVRYDPNVVQVPIQRGENGGKTLPHRNVVKSLIKLGAWSGAAQTYDLPAGPAGQKSALLVQDGPGGPILAAARL